MARNQYKVYHLVPNPRGGWRVEGEKSKRASSWHESKDAAIERGRELAKSRKGQLIVHKEDGTIQTEWSYGNDPASSKG